MESQYVHKSNKTPPPGLAEQLWLTPPSHWSQVATHQILQTLLSRSDIDPNYEVFPEITEENIRYLKVKWNTVLIL